MWQTLFAISAVVSTGFAGFAWLNRNIVKKSDIQKLRDKIDEQGEQNSRENTHIMALIEQQRQEGERLERRIENHIYFGTHQRNVKQNPLDGTNDE